MKGAPFSYTYNQDPMISPHKKDTPTLWQVILYIGMVHQIEAQLSHNGGQNRYLQPPSPYSTLNNEIRAIRYVVRYTPILLIISRAYLAMDKKTAPRPESHALRKLSSANVVSTTSLVSIKMSFFSKSCVIQLVREVMGHQYQLHEHGKGYDLVL